jgi:hypothetical protein
VDYLGVGWNLLLAAVPVPLAWAAAALLRRGHPAGWPLLVVWLAFLPNSAYLVTGWHHFLSLTPQGQLGDALWERRGGVPMFPVRVACYGLYAASGLFALALALRPILVWCGPAENAAGLLPAAQNLTSEAPAARSPWPQRARHTALTLLFVVLAQGVLVGRIYRFNSWDLALQPMSVLRTFWEAWTPAGKIPGGGLGIMALAAGLWSGWRLADRALELLGARGREGMECT